MRIIYDFANNYNNNQYARMFAMRQTVLANNGKDDLIYVHTGNPDYQEYGIVNPWMDGNKNLSQQEAYKLYGKDAVDKFVSDVIADQKHEVLLRVYRFKDQEDAFLLKRIPENDSQYYVIEQNGKSVSATTPAKCTEWLEEKVKNAC